MNDFAKLLEDLSSEQHKNSLLSEANADLKQESEQLKARVAELEQVLTNVKNCPESDLTQYCMSVDSMVCEALAKTEQQSLASIQADAFASVHLDEYDAGYLPDNPDQDYVRYELSRAFDFYESQLQSHAQQLRNSKGGE